MNDEAVTVLLVEDNDGDAVLVREAIDDGYRRSHPDCHVVRVESLTEALDWLETNPVPDCALVDLGLPDASDMQAVDGVLQQAPWLPVVVLTGNDDPSSVGRALARGAQDWLVKGRGLTPDLLERTLRHAVQRGQAYAELGRSRDDLARFAQTVAHDVKGPIGAISGYLELIHMMLTKGEPVEETVELIVRTRDAAVRLAELTDGLLTYAEVPVDESHVDVDLEDVVAWVNELVGASVSEAGGKLRVDGVLPTVRGHAAGLRQVLLNLVTNAVKYRDPDRALDVVVAAEPTEAGLVEVTVTDNGIGIPVDQREHVLEPGVRGPSGAHGLGLGLAAVRRVVERHRGRIWLTEGPDGVGTRVHFTLVPA